MATQLGDHPQARPCRLPKPMARGENIGSPLPDPRLDFTGGIGSDSAMDTTKRYRLHHSLGYHLSIASRLQERRLDEKLKPVGLTRTTWCILLAIGNENLSQPSDIADFVGIDRTATSRALRHMEQEGWLMRSSGTEDRRTRQVVLTDTGRDLIRMCTPYAQENAETMRQALSSKEEAELKRLLAKLRDSAPEPLPTL